MPLPAGPDPNVIHPMEGVAQVAFLKPIIDTTQWSSVPAYCIAVDNPARAVKRRFADDIVARLLAVRWWNWPAAKITANLAAITGADIDALEKAAAS